MLYLKLNPQDAALILKGLGALPLSESFQTFMRVNQQLTEQQQQPAAAAPKPEGKPGEGQEPAKPVANGEEPKTVN